MRFIHTSDWHLGKTLCNASLLDDQAYALEQVLRTLRDTRPDALVISGDIYDRSIPPKEAVALLDEFLSKAVREEGIPVLMIAGNHDSPERLAFLSRFLGEQGVYVAGSPGSESEPVILGHTAFHLIPYADPATTRAALGSDEIRTHQDALSALCNQVHRQHPPGRRCVILAHAFVAGGQTSESEMALSIGGSGEVEGRLFAPFDYTALGHLHRPQDVGGMSHVHYAGSLLKYSASEAGQVKALTLVELPASGPARTMPIPLEPKRDLRRRRGYFQDLLEDPGEGSPEDYLFLELLDEGPILDAMARLRRIYPHILGIQPARPSEERLPEVISLDHRSLDPENLFARFYEDITGAPLSEEETALYREVAHEAGLLEGRLP